LASERFLDLLHGCELVLDDARAEERHETREKYAI